MFTLYTKVKKSGMLQSYLFPYERIQVFHNVDELVILAPVALIFEYQKKKKTATKYYLQWGLNWGCLPFQFNSFPKWGKLAFACMSETLGALHSDLTLTSYILI